MTFALTMCFVLGLVPDPEPQRRPRPTSLMQITHEQAEELSKTNLDEHLQLSERLLIETATERARDVKVNDDEPVPDEEHINKCTHCGKSFKKPR
jgi:hypothetical protein